VQRSGIPEIRFSQRSRGILLDDLDRLIAVHAMPAAKVAQWPGQWVQRTSAPLSEGQAAEDIAKRRTALEAADIPLAKGEDPLVYLTEIMIDETQPRDVRMKAARELAPYKHARKTENTNINKTRYVVALSSGEVSMDEWLARAKPAEKKETHH
jgi:hypothetical protein